MGANDSILRQIDDLLETAQRTLGPLEVSALKNRLLTAIERLAPGTPYVSAAQRSAAVYTGSKALEELLRAIRADYAAGYFATVRELVHADVFADFLEMADELLSKGYKDPAAVVAGSVLEEHLRKLAQRNDVTIENGDGRPLKADRINADLARAEVFNKLEQKSVTAWLDLRNKAAHGEYDQYEANQVAALIASIRDFLLRHPA